MQCAAPVLVSCGPPKGFKEQPLGPELLTVACEVQRFPNDTENDAEESGFWPRRIRTHRTKSVSSVARLLVLVAASLILAVDGESRQYFDGPTSDEGNLRRSSAALESGCSVASDCLPSDYFDTTILRPSIVGGVISDRMGFTLAFSG